MCTWQLESGSKIDEIMNNSIHFGNKSKMQLKDQLWISCVKTLTAFAYLRGAGGAEFQRYEIWACKRQPCMLYSGDTCVLMDTAPANHGHLKWLSMQVAILSSLSLNIFQYLDLLESPLISFFGSSYLIWNDALGGTVVFMLLFCWFVPFMCWLTLHNP